jgi:hypothetical protein
MTKLNPQKKKSLNPFLQFIGLGFQIGITVFLAHKFGTWLDTKWAISNHLFSKVSTILGVCISVYLVISQSKKISQ